MLYEVITIMTETLSTAIEEGVGNMAEWKQDIKIEGETGLLGISNPHEENGNYFYGS